MAKGNGKELETPEEHTAEIVYPEMLEDERPLYSNSFLVNHSPWDFALHFNYVATPIKPPKDSTPITIQARRVAVIAIPPTLIRGLITALQTNLKRYEEHYGEITIPQQKGGVET